MIKLLAVGVWASIVTLGSGYVVASMSAPVPEAGEDMPNYYIGLVYRKTGAITVPMIAEQAVRGYLVARFVYTIDNRIVDTLSVPPDPFILDEAFRRLYSSDDFDFDKPEKFDLPALTGAIKTAVNARYDEELVHEVLIEQFDYVPNNASRAGTAG